MDHMSITSLGFYLRICSAVADQEAVRCKHKKSVLLLFLRRNHQPKMALLTFTLPLNLVPASPGRPFSSSSSSSSVSCSMGPTSSSQSFPCSEALAPLILHSRRRSSHVVRMAPEEEKMTRRSPLDFPIEWERPKPGRRPDIFPQFAPIKTPLPSPMPADPPEEEDEEEEKKEEEEEGDDPDKENPENPPNQ